MLIDQININNLRIFETVYKHRSMTKAANILCLGQSGVSQHVKNLENLLELKLFDRIKNKLVPTHFADDLYESCSKSFFDIEGTLRKLKGVENILIGDVVIGLPIEFGNNVILPLLSKFGQKHCCVNYKIVYGFASEMNQYLLDGKMDFAFVDNFPFDPNIKTKKVYEEVLYLCAAKSYLKKNDVANKRNRNKKYFESLDYIKFMDNESIIQTWLKHHYGLTNVFVNVRGTLMNIEGAGRLIASGLGAGILPEHMYKKLIGRGCDIYVYQGKKKNKNELSNSISIAWAKNKTMSFATNELMSYLSENL